MAGQAALTFRLAHETDVDFSIDVPPFLGLSKRSNQLLKLLGMLGSVFKPREKVEGFTNIAAMIKLPCDGRQMFYPFSDVMGFFLKNIATFLL